MTSQGVYRCFESLLDLSLDKQAQCVRLAAEASVDVWQQHCREQSIEDLSPALFACFDRWKNGKATDEELTRVVERLGSSLPSDVRKERRPAGAYAGYALVDIALIALGKCNEVHDSVLHTAIYYAASAYCGIGTEAVWVNLDRLTVPELDFLESWWSRCRVQFPELADCE